MRNLRLIILLGAIYLVCSCVLLEDNIHSGLPRKDLRSRPPIRDSTSIKNPIDISKADSLILCCAIRFAKDYDWHKDSLGNNERCELLLFRNGKFEQSIVAGKGSYISAAADFHHFIDGELYSECCLGDKTIISRNGTEIIRFNGAEILYGLVIKNNDIHSLSRRQNGTGFTYRINGELIFIRNEGSLFGSFSSPSYPETGALYEDEGKVVFCYREKGAYGPVFHKVINGEDKIISLPFGQTICDIKIIEGEMKYSSVNSHSVTWSESWVLLDSDYQIGGFSLDKTCVSKAERDKLSLCEQAASFYCSGPFAAAVRQDSSGEVDIYYSDGRIINTGQTWHYFKNDCAMFVGKDLLVGLTPKDSDIGAKLIFGSKTYLLEELSNGYICAVYGKISPPK